MNVKALEILVGALRIGVLFQYAQEGAPVINRFVADPAFIEVEDPPVLSLSYQADEQALFWRDIGGPQFNGRLSKDGQTWLLPSFFQNLLPEGVFREQLAQLRGCEKGDNFELLAASGKDLPGNVYALPAHLGRQELATYVTQNADALEMTVTAEPLDEGVSISGMQAKLAVIKEGERYVARTKDQDTHIIAKLPVIGYPLLPEVEDLSLRLAKAAGVDACEAYLEPLHKLAAQHNYDLGDVNGQTNFLAVVRYDRKPGLRIHCEDFAQVFGVMPEDKYSLNYSYTTIAGTMMAYPSLGEPAVHELLRRIVVNELLGNPDMHLKNIGLWYPDGEAPKLPPAYDLVAHTLFAPVTGHGLRILPARQEQLLPKRGSEEVKSRKITMSPAVLRSFCNLVDIPERPASKVISDCVTAAFKMWPKLIRESAIAETQKAKMMAHLGKHPLISGLARRHHL